MDIRERYNLLASKELTNADIYDIQEFKKLCRNHNNLEYLYLGEILLIDLYINNSEYDKALEIALDNLAKVDSNVFKNIYLYLLERIIYIYINKKNYKSAYRYIYRKKNIIDLDNPEEVNRWYLELSYVYAELNELNRSLRNLEAILENYPNDEIKVIALSNMTKLYIDQGMIKEAKDTLNQCLELVIKLGDEEGKLYCDYLLAQIYILEKNFHFAKRIYDDIFKDKEEIPKEYLNLVNEYILLLLNMELYDDSLSIIKHYYPLFEDANDYIKREFYKNILKASIYNNPVQAKNLTSILNKIDELDTKIAQDKEAVLSEAAEDEKNEEIQQNLKKTINDLEKTIDILTLALIHDDKRASLMDFSKRLEEIINYEEALYIVLLDSNDDFLPSYIENFNQFTSYQYKKDRLYERNHPYSSLVNTPVEYILENKRELILDLNDSNLILKDLISTKTYQELNVNSIAAFPLFHNEELYGVSVFTSKADLTKEKNAILLKIAVKLLEFRLSAFYYQDGLRNQRNILQLAINRLQDGVFYYSPNNEKYFLTDKLQKFLSSEHRYISKEEYYALIHPEDNNNHLKTVSQAISNGENYTIYYRIKHNGNYEYVKEVADPYITSDGFIKYYIGSLYKLSLEEVDNLINPSLGDEKNIEEKKAQLARQTANPEFKFSAVRMKVNNFNDLNISYKKLTPYLTNTLRAQFPIGNELIYSLDDGSFLFILDNCVDQRRLDSYLKNSFNNLSSLVIDNKVHYLDVKFAIARYPRDSVNVNTIFEYLDVILKVDNGDTYYNNEISMNYINQNNINLCLNQYLQSENELLYYPVIVDNNNYFLVYNNIKGLELNHNYRHNFYNKELIKLLDNKTYLQMYKELKIHNQEVLLISNPETLRQLIYHKHISNHNLNSKTTIILDSLFAYNQLNYNLISELLGFNFKVGITYETLKKADINIINKFKPLIYTDVIINEDDLELIRVLGLKIIDNSDSKDKGKFYPLKDIIKR